jgi:hypothetical protein
MADLQFPTNRLGALQATQNFAPGTIGYGVHQGIQLLSCHHSK